MRRNRARRISRGVAAPETIQARRRYWLESGRRAHRARAKAAMTRVYLSLGSNLNPEENLRSGVAALREKFGDVAVSPTYRFPAVGFDGPDFLNLAAGIDTDMSAAALNDWLHALE